MTTPEMHSAFRVLGQQQGMQLMRGILPESIDIYLNNVINAMVREELLANAKTVFQDNVNTHPTALGPANVLRTLYRNYDIKIKGETKTANNKKIKSYNENTGYYEIYMPVKANANDGYSDEQLDIMMYLGFSIIWADSTGNEINTKEATGVRMIGGDVLETTFRDYCNGADKQNPVATLLTESISNSVGDESGYAKEFIQLYTNTKDIKIYKIKLKYIAAPNQVKYDIDSDKCVNCDLPEYLHYEIVRRAVALFFTTMGGNQQSNQNNNNN